MQQSQAHSAAKKLSKPNATQLKAMQYNAATGTYNIPEGERGLDTIKQILAYCEEHSLQAPTFSELFLQSDQTTFYTKNQNIAAMISFPILFTLQQSELDEEDREGYYDNMSNLHEGIRSTAFCHFITDVPFNQSPFYQHPDGQFYFDFPEDNKSINWLFTYFNTPRGKMINKTKKAICAELRYPFVTAYKTTEKATLSDARGLI